MTFTGKKRDEVPPSRRLHMTIRAKDPTSFVNCITR
ncbi:hypothetical protein JMJ77_0005116, partial [Colletotrichum scovillei]